MPSQDKMVEFTDRRKLSLMPSFDGAAVCDSPIAKSVASLTLFTFVSLGSWQTRLPFDPHGEG
jgi:hypothetical protein